MDLRCRHVIVPRKNARNREVGPCDKLADYVLDYGGGVGSCKRHLGLTVAWVLEDHKNVEVFTTEMWDYLHSSELELEGDGVVL